MENWVFDRIKPSGVRVGITQRDQFDNDEVGLTEALVREVIQNSNDAAKHNGPVKVRFQINHVSSPNREALVAKIGNLTKHLKACEIDYSVIGKDSRILCIEDFNTTGLTGSFEELDGKDFDNFWRAIGDSNKHGKAGGRWGLGKLVFSSSSHLRMFYGLTVRDGDHSPALLGQTVLQNHKIEDDYYVAHGMWCDGSIGDLELQKPFSQQQQIDWFKKLTGSERSTQTGLSIAIPFLKDSITEDEILFYAARNYFFPILAGKLEIEVGGQLLNAANFSSLVRNMEKFEQVPIPFNFVSKVGSGPESEPNATILHKLNEATIDENSFKPEILETLKATYQDGEMVHIRAPISVKKIGKPETMSSVDLFLITCPEDETPYTLFSRGPIVLSAETSHFRGFSAHGAMIAMDEPIADLLGDAENPAHTSWNLTATKLTQNWDGNPGNIVRSVRKALKSLFFLIAEQDEHKNETILQDFFSIADKAAKSSGRRKKKNKNSIPETPPREKAINIEEIENGFKLCSAPGVLTWEFPRKIRIKVAYDVQQGNPFKLHSKFDFDCRKLKFEIENGDVEFQDSNILIFTVNSDQFLLNAHGFDPNRDLIIEARAQ